MQEDTNERRGTREASSGPWAAHENRLIHEKSPYLLQHAHNPVDWYHWGDEAFDRAKDENKPIFLSIGYSTCHWCHVMEHETFEDEEAARVMNESFVSIKVDREERPDIDRIYMTVCQMMTGAGGWPLSIIMTPDKKPFFAGTYIPRDSMRGRMGMLDLCRSVKQLWTARREEVIRTAATIVARLKEVPESAAGEAIGPSVSQKAYEELSQRYDAFHGGFGRAPKFPTPHNFFFLLRYGRRIRDKEPLRMVEKTLQAMRIGGIYDHVGFGFHRYSTDTSWLVPHFEKMLYDQALLALAYTETYQATGHKAYRRTAEEIFTYVLRDMTSPEGGFYSAEDADSEGVEGKFYVWKLGEIRDALDEEDSDLAVRIFNVKPEGNFHEEATGRVTGANILHLQAPVSEIASDLGMSVDGLETRLQAIRKKLFDRREKRVRPHRDDKVLTDGNGLMIAALAAGARAFDRPEYADAAGRAADFILRTMRTPDGRLLHRYRDADAAIAAVVDDYAFFIWGLLELYEATFRVEYLKTALALNDDFITHFWDEETGGFYYTPDDGEHLLVRMKEIYDGATPSGNSVAALNLLRLGRITGRPDLEGKAEQIGRAFAKSVEQYPSAYTQMLTAVEFAIGPSYEVVISGDAESEDTKALLRSLHQPFVPNKVVVFRPAGPDSSEIVGLAPYTRDQVVLDGKATAYVCRHFACELPTTDPHAMLGLLGLGQSCQRLGTTSIRWHPRTICAILAP